MPQRPHHRSHPRTALAAIAAALLLAILASYACGSGGTSDGTTPQPGATSPGAAPSSVDPSFRTAIATIPDRKFTLYWLGTGFTAAGTSYEGPEVPYGVLVENGILQFQYYCQDPPSCGTGLQFVLYSPEAWTASKETVLHPRSVTSVDRKTATLLGITAQVLFVGLAPNPLNEIVVILELPDVTVVARTDAIGAATPSGPDRNPLLDETTLLNVLQNLRPYPQ